MTPARLMWERGVKYEYIASCGLESRAMRYTITSKDACILVYSQEEVFPLFLMLLTADDWDIR